MGFNNFRFQIIWRIFCLIATIVLALRLWVHAQYYITAFTLGLTALVQLVLLVRYAEQATTLFSRFLSAIQYDDFSQNYQLAGLGHRFKALSQEFERVMQKFQEIRAEKEAQYHYLDTIVQHIAIGLLVYDEQGQIRLFNEAAQQLLGIKRLRHLTQLQKTHPDLLLQLENPEPQRREVVKLIQDDRIVHLAMRRTAITLRQENLRIISWQDIQTELDDKEMEAWQNLIRVLTHEIINSVTPIASLSATINDDLARHIDRLQAHQAANSPDLPPSQEAFEEAAQEMHYAIQIIQKRSEGLIRFVQDFRRLTKIPLPQLENLRLKDLIDSVVFLQKEEFRKNRVNFEAHIQPETLDIMADPRLIEQVFINLLKNAAQALAEKEDRQIWLRARREAAGKTLVEIEDNGAGISADALKNIFIPFFTTKKAGSGIGLSFSRQVMRLHGGNILVKSHLSQGTVFTLVFP
ncbi:MAG: ATP-binding protein [Microscillaceae bacterium]